MPRRIALVAHAFRRSGWRRAQAPAKRGGRKMGDRREQRPVARLTREDEPVSVTDINPQNL